MLLVSQRRHAVGARAADELVLGPGAPGAEGALWAVGLSKDTLLFPPGLFTAGLSKASNILKSILFRAITEDKSGSCLVRLQIKLAVVGANQSGTRDCGPVR